MNREELVNNFPEYRGQVSHTEKIPERDGDFVNPEARLPKEISDNLPFEKIYSHQARSLWEIKAGSNVCVKTETSSGKTLIYALAIARRKINKGEVSSLLVYPTKALSRDQKKELEALYDTLGIDIDIGVYDGDTDRDEKRRIRQESDIVITNLQGLNHYLPYHKKWEDIFLEMDFLVIDEGHMYTGVSGMHASWIIRRLMRVLDKVYNSSPQIILSSATIGNPEEQARKLTGEEFVIIEKDGSPRGETEIALWNPPSYTDDEGTHRRRSSHKESAKVVTHLASKGYQTLCFCKSRKLTELIRKWAEEFSEENYDESITIESYNAGYNKKERREIEKRFKNGDIDALVSTNALEVGIDIGSIECTVIDSFPGSRISFFQQIGRSGRGTQKSLSVLVLKNDSIDQYINNNPNHLFSKNLEECVIDLDNKQVILKHVLAAANESYIDRRDINYFGEELENVVPILESQGKLEGQSLSKGYHYSGEGRPDSDISIYSTNENKYNIKIRENGETIKKLPDEDMTRVFRDFHLGAVHLHRGEKYIVTELNKDERYVHLEKTNVDYTTVSTSDVRISNVEGEDSYDLGEFSIHRGRATVQESFDTYSKIYDETGEKEDGFSTEINESVDIRTHTMWIEPPVTKPLMGSLHAAEHSMIKISPTVLKIDSKDIGGLSVNSHKVTNGEPAIFIYDGINGGVGFSNSIYNNIREILEKASNRLDNCDCSSKEGCPACTMSSSCGDGNEPLNREGAIDIMKELGDKFK